MIYLKALFGSILALIIGMAISIIIPLVIGIIIVIPAMVIFEVVVDLVVRNIGNYSSIENKLKQSQYIARMEESRLYFEKLEYEKKHKPPVLTDEQRAWRERLIRSNNRSMDKCTNILLKSKDEKELAKARKDLRMYIISTHHAKRQLEAGRYDIEWEDPTIESNQ